MKHTLSIVVLASLLIAGCYKMPHMPVPTVPEVIVTQVVKDKVQLYRYKTGITEAEAMVNVVARVSGFLEQRYFKDSVVVKPGDPLFLIEQAQYKANLDAANAAVEVAQARVALAQANAARAESLVKAQPPAISVEEYQTRVAEYQEAVATLAKSQADSRLAKLNLDYTQVYAPIAGMVSTSLIKVGNLVGSNSNDSLLTTIQQMDPINVLMDVTDVEFNEVMAELAKAEGKSATQTTDAVVESSAGTRLGGTIPAVTELPEMKPVAQTQVTPLLQVDAESGAKRTMFDIALPSGSEQPDYAFTGEITAIDNTFKVDTGQIRLRGKIPNPDYRIFPGQICRVRFYHPQKTELLLIEEEAVLTDLSQKYVLTVDGEGKVSRRNVELGELIDTHRRAVKSGLVEGETYIVRGTQKAKIGEKVVPKKSGE
ncbi:MAG: efflux RND transporter periplasmic adaptor subunit [Thermoguttaceae bacterium]